MGLAEAVTPESEDFQADRVQSYILASDLEFAASDLEERIFLIIAYNDALDATEFELLRDEALGILASVEQQRLQTRLQADTLLRARKRFVSDLVAAVHRSVEQLGREINSFLPVLVRFFRSRRPELAEDLASEVKVRAFQKGRGLSLSGTDLQKYLYKFAGLIALEAGHDRLRTAGTNDDLERLTENRSVKALAEPEEQLLSADTIRRCSKVLGETDFQILVEYWAGDRLELARKLKLLPGTLRVRVHRLGKELKKALGGE